MAIAAKLDEYGKPAWIGVTILTFVVFWPLGLVLLAYLFWSGRLGCQKSNGPGRWYCTKDAQGRTRGQYWKGGSSGNSAFDAYREETIRRLEEEQSEFEAFLERLRQAKDKAEFDQFMAERGNRPQGGPDNAAGAQPQA